MAPPDFADQDAFPSLASLPTTEDSDEGLSGKWWLVVQIKERMTITKPTVVAADREGVDLAVTFEEAGVDESAWRKGRCLVIPQARRTVGKATGFVRVPEGQAGSVKTVPGGWDVLRRMGDVSDSTCAGCGGEGTSRCLGCGVVRYCGKECQVAGWTGGHKGECKGFKAIREIWGDEANE
ncbi:hypothetical protein B0I35DRAFT_118151 [Stachybotrys elegans]|uniref:MYND-type domain-containing protein n=1 Tax=Stachybotrys elegans TaxID=80388 RepID=A0A8K0WWD6_9HYPO|nr:hypothetical protein B0I35DRAFT_118151 [Stachybotrys elegans]